MKTSVNKSRYTVTILTLLFSLLFFTASFAEEVDESALFSDEETVVESSTLEKDVEKSLDTESLAFSGRLLTRGVYYMSRSWLYEGDNFDTNQLTSACVGDFFLDARLKNGVKGFVNVAIERVGHEFDPLKSLGMETASEENRETEDPESDMEETLKEFFIDANAGRKVYFRIGKQVLKWGRTYFWNPTDFINIEKRDFFDMNRYREGVYGIRAHIPNGSQKNLYLFMNFSSADNLDGTAQAIKYEFLVNNTEFALSAWNKSKTGHALGVDFSTTLFGLYVNSEASFYHQDKFFSVDVDGDTFTLKEEKNKESVRVSIGATKTFDYELSDRISLTYEFFYNGSGYDTPLLDTVLTYVENNPSEAVSDYLAESINDLYEPNYYGKYYSALFFAITKYPIPDMTANLNILSNMSDGSFVVIPGVSYEPVDHFTVSFNLDFFGGPDNTEYTFMNTGAACELSIELQF